MNGRGNGVITPFGPCQFQAWLRLSGCSDLNGKTKRSRTIGADRHTLPIPPHNLLDRASLFLDLDGTLLELVDRPETVVADSGLIDLLVHLGLRLGGRLAVVSGRSLEQIDTILGDLAGELALCGSHGCEYRWQGKLISPARPETLDRAAARIRAVIGQEPGLLLEEKSYGVALHYRMKPSAEAAVRSMAEELAQELGLLLQLGKMMAELRVAGDKGDAIFHLMGCAPMQGTTPVFIGDDVTDEPAFEAARKLGGHGILIGQPRPTAASFGLASPSDLRGWLADELR